jgi:hypothetical protein
VVDARARPQIPRDGPFAITVSATAIVRIGRRQAEQ